MNCIIFEGKKQQKKCSSMLDSNRNILLALFIVILTKSINGCPETCTCKWKNGKQTVECINKELLIIPDGMDSGTQVLEFCGNNLQTLQKDKFLKMDLINLQRIYLCYCRLKKLDDRAFNGLTNLVELDLSNNYLESVPSGIFLDCPSLMRLILNSNPIRTIQKSAFNHLTYLQTLELSFCELTKIEDGAFTGLFSLEYLNLNGNKLTAVLNHFPESLKGIQLQDNPWECDCHIIELYKWLKIFNIPHTYEPICNNPTRLKGYKIKTIELNELACLPEVSPTTFYLEIGEGKNVSLLCHVNAIPEAKISWQFQGQLLQNDTMIVPDLHLIYFIEEGNIEKRSELFIYNTNNDDNGTFICKAENPAGVVQANFTIRIIVKRENLNEIDDLQNEFILITIVTTVISIILLLFFIICTIVKCQRNSNLKKKRNNTKVALSNTTKDNLLQDSIDDYTDNNYKESIDSKLVEQEEETMLYNTTNNDDLVRTISPPIVNLVGNSNNNSPTISLHRYQLEQNPDLINGTETVGRYRNETDNRQEILTNFHHHHHHSHHHHHHHHTTPNKKRLPAQFPNNEHDLYVLTPDVHLNPVGLLNPSDTRNCYKTLPYNRSGSNRRPTAANPIGRYSREAEFLSRTAPLSYEHYPADVRYTADGYPVRTTSMETTTTTTATTSYPSPVESHKSDCSAVEQCCSTLNETTETTTRINWPPCVPANLIKNDNIGVKCVVGAQTQTDNNEICNTNNNNTNNNNKIINKPLNSLVKVQETLTESPDEGYEGDENNSCQN